MLRPCFLIIDREYSGSISTRKLVIETGKFNVITAYTGGEGLETLAAFPAVHGVVLDAGIEDIPCEQMLSRLRHIKPAIPIVVVGGPRQQRCDGADYFLDTFDPARLLDLLRALEPAKTAVISQNEKDLAR